MKKITATKFIDRMRCISAANNILECCFLGQLQGRPPSWRQTEGATEGDVLVSNP
jgi:hypothetical protein